MLKNYTFFCLAFILIIIFSGCSSNYVSVSKIYLNKDFLASTFVGSPDPMQDNPPAGEKIFVIWRVPFMLKPSDTKILLHVIYRNLTEETITREVTMRGGIFSYSIFGDKYKEKMGLLAYKADLINKENNEIIDTWQHQMWVKLLY